MAKQVQLRRGTTSEHSTFTGAVGEITVDTTKNTVVVHDGSTAGGIPLARQSSVDLKANSTDMTTVLALKANLASPTFTGTPTAPTPTAGDNSTKIATTEFVQKEKRAFVYIIDNSASAQAATSSFETTPLVINFTPKSATSKIKISATIGMGGRGHVGAIFINGTQITGQGLANRIICFAMDQDIENPSWSTSGVNIVDSWGTTQETVEYRIKRYNDSVGSYDPRYHTTSLIIEEIL